ncbi:MAG: metallophosphoesterase [Tissierellia bacterium]|nr:metallophosphoesterase [Tissierellia bacterium]
MRIWAIGDIHLDHTKEKAMGIFGDHWKDHDEKIYRAWMEKVKEDDLVLIPGDISWALKWEEAQKDLEFIDELPGKKILSKGNHDYWWSGMKKMESKNWKSIKFLQNNSFFTEDGIGIFGTRGWIASDTDNFTEQDLKIKKREVLRLGLSFESMKEKCKKKIVMIHYPPFQQDFSGNEFTDMMEREEVDICIYGHLHGDGHRYVLEEERKGVNYICVAADYINFSPIRLEV